MKRCPDLSVNNSLSPQISTLRYYDYVMDSCEGSGGTVLQRCGLTRDDVIRLTAGFKSVDSGTGGPEV